MVAVLAALAAVLATAQSSSGVETATSNSASPSAAPLLAGPTPTSPGTTDVASAADGTSTPGGGFAPMLSGDGRWEVFTSTANLQPGNPSASAGQSNVFVRDLRTGSTVQLSRGLSGSVPAPPSAGSLQPSISDDGRYVTFLTDATNIVTTTGTSPLTLVVCNRDPDDDGIFDETNPDGSLTNACAPVYSNAGTGAGSIDRFDRPVLAGFANRVAWTQNAGSGITHVWSASFTFANSTVTPDPPVQLPMNLADPDPALCGGRPGGAGTVESQPAITDNASEIVATVEFAWGSFCTAIVATNNLSAPGFATSTRLDRVPAGCGSGFLGDGVTLTGLCAGGSGGGDHSVGGPAVDEFGSNVLFDYHDGPVVIGFAGPRALAPTADTDWTLVTSGSTAQLVSRDNAGNPVNSSGGAISEDGRYVAFGTSAANTHDGADLSSGSNEQIVARDLELDAVRQGAGQSRLPGALVTPRDPGRSTPANCTPSANQSCASAGGTVGSISMDGVGARVAYAGSATDLLGSDTAGTNAYVRTWTPTLTDPNVDAGTIQTGATKTFSVAVTTSGFGPLRITQSSLGGADAADFTIVGDGCANVALHVNQSCSVTLRFAPTTDGAKNATVRLATQYRATTVEGATVTASSTPGGPKNAPADTVRTSLRPNGGQVDVGGDQSMVSGDGRWDVFVSRGNLANRPISPDSGKSGVSNVYVRDLADPQTTVQISLHAVVPGGPDQVSRPAATPTSAIGANPNDDSFDPTISSDGRFVSFVTAASDVVPIRVFGDHAPDFQVDYTIVVCDRDPDGDGKFDELRAGTSVPDYRCFPVQSGAFNDGGRSPDLNSRPNLAGNGSRITYVESDDSAQDSRRVRVADLPVTAGGLQAPTNFADVSSTVSGFEHGADRTDSSNVEQTQPALTEDGSKVVYDAVQHIFEGPAPRFAVIEADLAAGTDQRVDGLGAGNLAPPFEIEDGPAVSDDGNRVAFSYVDPAVDESRVYVSTADSGGNFSSRIVSLDNSGAPAPAIRAALSGDGRYVAFVTQASDMSNGVDPPGGHCNDQSETDLHVVCQVVARDLVRDLQRAANDQPFEPSELVSTSIATCVPKLPAGRLCGAGEDVTNPSIDNTGSEIGFDTAAADVVPGDTNVDNGEGGPFPVTDTFVHTWRPTVITPNLAFGTVKVGASKTKTFTARIQDFGPVPVAFGPISLGASKIVGTNPGDFTIVSTTCAGTTLHVGPDGTPESCTYKIRFTPTVAGPRTATLQTKIAKNSYPRHNPANTISYDPAVVRQLTGFGALPVITLNPSTLDFGTRLPEDPVTKTLTVTNSGSAPLVIAGVVVNDTTHPGAKGDYTVDATDCLGSTAPGASCVIKVTFRDHRIGIRDAVLVIDDNTAAGSTSVTLLARAKKPTVLANPGVSPVRRVITITGTGFAPKHDVEIGFDGAVQQTVKARANGTFELQLVVLPNGPQGPRTLFGHSVGYHKSIAADFPFLVVLSSTDPAAGVVIRD